MMKRIVILLFFLSLSPLANAFNNSHFSGTYAFRLVGTSSFVLSNLPFTVGTGLLNANGNGKISGHGVFRTAGISCKGNIEGGNYTLANDGTGTLAAVFQPNTPGCFRSSFIFNIVLADNGNSFEISSIENDYLSGTLTRQKRK